MARWLRATTLLLAGIAAAGWGPPRLGPGERVLLTTAQALEEIFPGHGPVAVERFGLGAGARNRIEERSGAAMPPGPVEVMRVSDRAGGPLGWALVLDERGKYRPITFMVGIGQDQKVRGVEVMVYREDRGDEVRHSRFLRQYRGKDTGDPIRAPGDIVNITGATISVHSLNRGVRRALATVDVVYRDGAADLVKTLPFDDGS